MDRRHTQVFTNKKQRVLKASAAVRVRREPWASIRRCVLSIPPALSRTTLPPHTHPTQTGAHRGHSYCFCVPQVPKTEEQRKANYDVRSMAPGGGQYGLFAYCTAGWPTSLSTAEAVTQSCAPPPSNGCLSTKRATSLPPPRPLPEPLIHPCRCCPRRHRCFHAYLRHEPRRLGCPRSPR